MKSTFIGEIFLLDFKGRQVLYILTETKLDYIEDAVYHLQTTGFLLHLFFSPWQPGVSSTTEARRVPVRVARHGVCACSEQLGGGMSRGFNGPASTCPCREDLAASVGGSTLNSHR